MATAANFSSDGYEEPEWNSGPQFKMPGWFEPVVCTSSPCRIDVFLTILSDGGEYSHSVHDTYKKTQLQDLRQTANAIQHLG